MKKFVLDYAAEDGKEAGPVQQSIISSTATAVQSS